MFYIVTIEETLRRRVQIEAPSAQEAEDFARTLYRQSEIVLDADDFNGYTSFRTTPAPGGCIASQSEDSFGNKALSEMDTRNRTDTFEDAEDKEDINDIEDVKGSYTFPDNNPSQA